MNQMIPRRWLIVGVAALLALSLSTALIVAQDTGFAPITWWTVDGGGGQSSGGSYRLSGTTGQRDAGMMAGGSYQIGGGYWEGGASTPTDGEQDVYLPFVTR